MAESNSITSSPPPPPPHLLPFFERFNDIPEPLRTRMLDACTQVILAEKETIPEDDQVEQSTLKLAQQDPKKHAEWWERVKRQREEDEMREFSRQLNSLKDYMRQLDEEQTDEDEVRESKRRRYALQDYTRQLEEGPRYRLRPYWWADHFVDDEEDDKILEIYD